MVLKSLVINNLYSFGQGVLCTFNTDLVSKTLITGVNKDEPGADSNGAGKSNILNTIFWTILGEVFQKENADDIIRRGQKSGSATLTLNNGHDIVIERGRGKGVKKFLRLKVGDTNLTCDTDKATQEELLKVLNISPKLKVGEIVNDFVNTCYFSSDSVKGFMAKEVKSKQRFEIIERYLGLKRYSFASEKAKMDKKVILTKLQPILDNIAQKEVYIEEHPVLGLEEQIVSYKEEIAEQELVVKTKETELLGNKPKEDFEHLVKTKKEYLENKRALYVEQLNSLEQSVNINNKSQLEKQDYIKSWLLEKDVVAQAEGQVEAKRSAHEVVVLDMADINSNLIKYNSSIAVINQTITQLDAQLKDHYKCPKCTAELMLTPTGLIVASTEELNNQRAEQVAQLAPINTNIQQLQKDNKDLTEKHTTFTTLVTDQEVAQKVFDKKATDLVVQKEIFDISEETKEYTQKYNDLSKVAEDSIIPLKTELEQLGQELLQMPTVEIDIPTINQALLLAKNTVKQGYVQIGRCEQELELIEKTKLEVTTKYASIKELKKEADILGFWELGFKQIKMNIIDNFLPEFEQRVNEYLDKLKVNLQVDFDTQKKKAKVSKKDLEQGRAFKEEFNVTVFRGESLLPYGLLSKGQRSRVGSCVGMALRELTKERGNNVFDFFFMDEIADSLDESGLRELVTLLDNVPGQKLIISHNEQLNNFIEDVITVEMLNEQSTITS